MSISPKELARQVEQLDEEEWYDFLDELDEVSRRRHKRGDTAAKPAGNGRDEVAAWVAKKHFIADNGVREIWYLPQGAPPDQIRFLEVSDRLADNGPKVEAIDFGLDVEGAQFGLFVADITTEQLNQIKEDLSVLPPGWSLDGSRVWRRRV